MKFRTLILLFLALALSAMVIFDSVTYSASVLGIFKDRSFSAEGLAMAESFEPPLPYSARLGAGTDSFFESVEDLSICRHREVRRFIYLYLTRDREYLVKSIGRSRSCLPLIRKIIAEGELPGDLALLPLLESGFEPMAVSKSGAVGLWQFIDGTSSIMGLRRDTWVDERRHTGKSTRAALRHLEELYRHFGTWELALAAYNGGSGHVARAMESSGSRTFWELLQKGALRQETAEYFPRFAALLVIYRNMDLLDIDDELPRAAPVPRESIALPSSIGVDRVATYAGIPVSMLKRLNPELNTIQPPPHQPVYTLIIPARSMKALAARTALLARETTAWNKPFTACHALPILPLVSLTGRM